MKPIRWLDLLEARSDFRRTWPQLLLTDLLARTIVMVFLTPMVGLLIMDDVGMVVAVVYCH